MSSSPAPSIPPVAPEAAPPPPTRRRLALAAGLGFALICLGGWIYILFIYDPGLLVDELADRRFPRAAEQVCAATMERLDALPPAETARDPVERADTVDQADALLTAMVAELRPLAPTEPAGAEEAVGEWLDDWDTHIADRADFARRLREDPDARFTETPKGSKQISRAIDGYAQVNRMPSCETPGDVG